MPHLGTSRTLVWLIGIFLLLDVVVAVWYVTHIQGRPIAPSFAGTGLQQAAPNPLGIFFGEVVAIDSNSITIRGRGDAKENTFAITEKTGITKTIPKDPGEFQKEMDEAMKNPGTTPPSMGTIMQIEAEDLQVGNMVTVVPVTPTSMEALTIEAANQNVGAPPLGPR